MASVQGSVRGMRSSPVVLVRLAGGRELAFALPFGVGVGPGMDVGVTLSGRGTLKRAVVRSMEDLVIFPPYSATQRIRNGKTLELRLISDYSQKQEALGLLSRLHYQGPATGLMLGAWIESDLVGCAVLGRLTFGMPTRRLEYYRAKRPRTGRDFVARRAIAWVRRFATSPEMQGLGVGTAMARHVRLLVPDYFRPRPELIEVITSRTTEDLRERGVVLRRDFLLRAGYKIIGAPWPRAGEPQKRWNGRESCVEKVRVKHFYYVCELPNKER